MKGRRLGSDWPTVVTKESLDSDRRTIVKINGDRWTAYDRKKGRFDSDHPTIVGK